jgi:hypothetical protein
MPKTTTEIIEEYELPDCPRELINKNLPFGEACNLCRWNKTICNKVWYDEEEVEKVKKWKEKKKRNIN